MTAGGGGRPGRRMRVGLLGGAGKVAGHLLRLLVEHPEVEIAFVASASLAGRPVVDEHRELRAVAALAGYTFVEPDIDCLASQCDIAMLAMEHGRGFDAVRRLVGAGVRVIDLSADFRLRGPAVYERWYRMAHGAPELVTEAVFGLTELHRAEIAAARLVANPGCYPTAAVLAAAPLFAHRLAEPTGIVVDAVSGFSGAGGKASPRTDPWFLFGSVRPYDVGTHRHTPEMEQELSRLAGQEVRLLFSPAVAGFKYGILANVYLRPRGRLLPGEELVSCYRGFYRREPFVRVYEPDEPLELAAVVGTNFCDLGPRADERTGTYVVTAAVDNMLKGAAGQAVQNLNVMAGLDERLGLPLGRALGAALW